MAVHGAAARMITPAMWMHYSIARPKNPTAQRVFQQRLEALREDADMLRRSRGPDQGVLHHASTGAAEARPEAGVHRFQRVDKRVHPVEGPPRPRRPEAPPLVARERGNAPPAPFA